MRRVLLLAVVVAGLAGCRKPVDPNYTPPALAQRLKDSDPNVRYSAARALGKYGPQAREYVPDLVQALKDRDKTVRMGAAYGLADVGPDALEAVPALKEALKDKDAEVRKAAAYALKKIEGPSKSS
jgi:vesicle coat complex subunit